MFYKPVKDIIKRTNELNIDLLMRSLFDDKGDELERFIINLNTQVQLFNQGIDNEGVELSLIGGGYAPVTIFFKQQRNLPIDRVTLFDTGEFYDSFTVTYESVGIVINADTIKDGKDLQSRWGSEIVGLTDNSQQRLIEFLYPLVNEWLIKYLLS